MAGDCLALWAQLDDRRGLGNALNTLAMVATDQGELAPPIAQRTKPA